MVKWLIVFILIMIAIPTWAAPKSKIKIKAPVEEVEAAESKEWNHKMCPKGIESLPPIQFTQLNPFDSKDRCFDNYFGKNVQLLNQHKAMYSFWTGNEPFVVIDFGKVSASMGLYRGIIKGKGAFSYTTVAGGQKIIISAVPVPKSEARENWEKKQDQIKKIKEEEEAKAKIIKEGEEAEARVRAEQEAKIKEVEEKVKKAEEMAARLNARIIAEEEWKRNPTYTDKSTGLMWTRSANIAGKPMQWVEALKFVQKLNYGQYTDWRIPTTAEFHEFTRNAVKFYPYRIIENWFEDNGFSNVQVGKDETSHYYWAQSAYTNGTICGESVGVYGGWQSCSRDKRDRYYVWPVRGSR